jgi:glycosyltransferase involved in cell wall biosynthesis
MKLSVIIPCFNAADTISTQLEALANQGWSNSWEIILSDNGSTDELLRIAERYNDRLANFRVVDASGRRGAAHARNVGALAAAGDALAFCDADDEVGSGWVAAMGAALTEYDFIASRIDTRKLNASWNRANPQRDGLQRLWYPPYLFHACGTGLGIKRLLHERIGGFDESVPTLEDTDYCLRLQLAGAELQFVPNAVVHYRRRNSFGGIYRQSRLWAEGNVLLYKRHGSAGVNASQLWRQYIIDWKPLLWRLPQIRNSKGRRVAWVWLLGRQIGRLKGSIKHRVPPV